MKNETLKNNSIEQEILSADQQQIRNLVGSLEKVSAPKDFDFRLKARIANADKTNFQPSVWQTLRYILPLTATAVIAAFVLFQAGIFSPSSDLAGKQTALISETQNRTELEQNFSSNNLVADVLNSNLNENKSEIVQTVSTPLPPKPKQNLTAKISVKKTERIITGILKDDDGGGSKDTTLTQSNVNIVPQGIPKNSFPIKQDNKNDFSISAQKVLEIFGVETENVDGKLKVSSVKEKSVGEKSGIKNEDLIEAIDQQKIDGKNSQLKSNTVKTIMVLREGKTVKIILKSN